jgi:phosphatidate cytidylyltransferase
MTESGAGLRDSQVLLRRVLSSVVAIPIIVVLVWFGAPWFTILAAGWGGGAVYEFYGIIKRAKGIEPLTYFGVFWVLLIIISPHFNQIPHFNTISPGSVLITSAIILSLLVFLWRRGKENAFVSWAWTTAGILYIGWLLSYMVALRNISSDQGTDYGRVWVFLAILGTFASDSCAYFGGRSFGKHRLAPYISPKKTWEGSIAGIAGAVAASIALVYLFRIYLPDLPINNWQTVILGILVSVMGQLGDLVKSLFKRNMEVKDSGNIVPGHGGFLDRMDSLAFAGVTAYYFFIFMLPAA